MSGYASGSGRAVEGLDIPPHDVYDIVVGLSATIPGRHVIPIVRLRYTSGGVRYEATFHQSVALCAPKAKYMEDGCPSPLD